MPHNSICLTRALENKEKRKAGAVSGIKEQPIQINNHLISEQDPEVAIPHYISILLRNGQNNWRKCRIPKLLRLIFYLLIDIKGDPNILENLERFELHTYRCEISIYIKKFWKAINQSVKQHFLRREILGNLQFSVF